MKSFLCLLALLPIVFGNLSSRYAFNTTLYDRDGDTYMLHWNFSTAERTIAFAVNVSTTGWVGFGISPNGGMTNSDVVIGWVWNGQQITEYQNSFRAPTPQFWQALDQIQWNPQTVQDLQRAALNGPQIILCNANGTLLIRERDYFPDVVCDYRAPDSCDPNNPPLPCCQCPEVTASGVMVVSSLLLMAAMTLVTLLL